MTLKILEEKENPLFGRKEIVFELSAEITPSNKETINLISKKLSIPEENIKIKRIKGGFGSKEFIIDANVYKIKEDKERIEKKSKKGVANTVEVKKESEEAKKVKAEEKKKAEEAKNAETSGKVKENKE
ncbi:MAG: hypothetical protein ABIE36_01935 [Candidatus Diapherotrites archaeon]